MFFRIVLVFTLLPVLELLGLWFCSGIFGPFGLLFTILVIVGTGLIGAFLARYQGLNCWLELNRQLDRGETPAQPIMHGILILFAAILLIVPGLITDFFGILLLIPPIRSLVISHIRLRFEAYRAQTGHRGPHHPSPEPPEVIDVE